MISELHSNTWGPAEIDDAKTLIGPVVILGASGFIGANLFFNLSRCRDDVFGCSKNIDTNWRFKHHNWQNLEKVDITSQIEVDQLFQGIQPKTIFNLSSYGGHAHQTDTGQIQQVNYIGTSNILESLRSLDFHAFVQAGSSSEYGLNSAGPKEDDELAPNSVYAVSKIGAYYLMKYYSEVFNFPAMHLRLYSVYGPWQERKTLMPVMISHCLENKWPPLVDSEASHDFIYVDDCTYAFVKAALALYEKKGLGKAVNIATGTKTTTKDLVDEYKQIFNVSPKPVFNSMQNKGRDLTAWYGNPQLAKELLDWHYHTSLEEGLRLVSEWEQQFKKTA
ncbi:MAG: NAD-dependent epimerase/dehydratase family protein [Candidatus Yanofskybacteria bacterium]|nr:NAD-dependent epimerase/dehydratase family protein [Candidatus Yanofskybacteria bacterium]